MADYSQERIEIGEAVVHEGRRLRASVRAKRRGDVTELVLSLTLFEKETTPGISTTLVGSPGWHGNLCIERVPRRSPSVMRRAVMQARVVMAEAVLALVLRSSELYGWEKGSATNNARAAADRIIAAIDADMVKRFPDLFTEARIPGVSRE